MLLWDIFYGKTEAQNSRKIQKFFNVVIMLKINVGKSGYDGVLLGEKFMWITVSAYWVTV